MTNRERNLTAVLLGIVVAVVLAMIYASVARAHDPYDDWVVLDDGSIVKDGRTLHCGPRQYGVCTSSIPAICNCFDIEIRDGGDVSDTDTGDLTMTADTIDITEIGNSNDGDFDLTTEAVILNYVTHELADAFIADGKLTLEYHCTGYLEGFTDLTVDLGSVSFRDCVPYRKVYAARDGQVKLWATYKSVVTPARDEVVTWPSE